MSAQRLRIGHLQDLSTRTTRAFSLPTHHLTTHAVVFGATGSGKSGKLVVLTEEVLRCQIPVLMIDVKGDLPNLGLAFPSFSPTLFEPWVEPGPGDPRTRAEVAETLAKERQQALQAWGIEHTDIERFVNEVDLRVITPGSTAGEPLHVLSSLERPSVDWHTDPERARASVSAAVSLVLRLLGLDPDPAKSRAHVLLSLLAERRMKAGLPSDLGQLLNDLLEPPMETVGALPIDNFVSSKERGALAASLNTLLASPTFASWREGAPLDVGSWLTPAPLTGKTPAVIVSVAHLEDDERALVLGVLFEELLNWVRSLPGTKHLRALIVFDEVYGFIPPHPANPPTKQPIVALMKQARAYGVGMVLATQNPMDVDYRTLGNAGIWVVGRLQTDADRARVVEGLAHNTPTGEQSAAALSRLIKQLAPRWFVMRNARSTEGTVLMQPRWAMSFLRGPMTPSEIRRVCAERRVATMRR